MKLFPLFFACLVVFLLLIGVFWFLDAPPDVTGQLHPEYKTMLKSGTPIAQLPAAKWSAFLFGIAIMAVFTFCLLIGAEKKGKLSPIKWWLIGGMGLYTLFYGFLVMTSWISATSGEATPYFDGFPVASAWMIYVIWFFPFFFTVLYVVTFDRWIMTPDELEQFHQMVAKNREVN